MHRPPSRRRKEAAVGDWDGHVCQSPLVPAKACQMANGGGDIVLAVMCWARSARRRCYPIRRPTLTPFVIVNKTLLSLSLSLSLSLFALTGNWVLCPSLSEERQRQRLFLAVLISLLDTHTLSVSRLSLSRARCAQSLSRIHTLSLSLSLTGHR
jgi:hypothetical protein